MLSKHDTKDCPKAECLIGNFYRCPKECHETARPQRATAIYLCGRCGVREIYSITDVGSGQTCAFRLRSLSGLSFQECGGRLVVAT